MRPLEYQISFYLFCSLVWLALPSPIQAQFSYTTNNDAITITGYTGPGGPAAIPATINGLPVTSIGDGAFADSSGITSLIIPFGVTSIGTGVFFFGNDLTNVTISASVTNISDLAFANNWSLTSINVDPQNPCFSSLNGVLFDKSQSSLIQFPGALVQSYTIPNSVTTIREWAFANSSGLTNLTIPSSVTSLENHAFFNCFNLISIKIYGCITNFAYFAFPGCSSVTAIYFQGNAPSLIQERNQHGQWFTYDNQAIVYYLPGTLDWGSTFGGLPTMLWNPLIQTENGNFGVRSNMFGFDITGTSNLVVKVDACANLANPVWLPIQTVSLTNGSAYFSDTQWTNSPNRFYRLSFP